MAQLAIKAGAEGITVHPRPDQRHIRPSDVRALSSFLRSEYDEQIEFNIEGNPTDGFLDLVKSVRPTQVTLVPDLPDQRTSDHGWDFLADGQKLTSIVAELVPLRIRVALFIDPDPDAIPFVRDTGANRIELYTGPYAEAFSTGSYKRVLSRYVTTARSASSVGLAVNAGHDLNLENLHAFKRAVPVLAEVSIGHALTADALRFGFPEAVKRYLAAMC
jgi:pyridoxine 5-phosphate synthase